MYFIKVLKTFFWFLTWYSMFIVAFGFGFYIILHTDTREPTQVQYSAVQCSAVQCSAVQCSAVQCSAVQCSAVQCSAV